MRLAEGDVLDDALELFHNHAWVEHKPVISVEQMAELVPVLAPLFQRSRPATRPPAKPKEQRPKTKVDRGSQAEGRRLVYGRSSGECEAGVPDVCAGIAREWHHRLNRSQGGRWDASNGLHLCRPCHAYVTDKARNEAKEKGWAVAPGVTPPADVPVLRRGVWVLLDDAGAVTPLELGGAAA